MRVSSAKPGGIVGGGLYPAHGGQGGQVHLEDILRQVPELLPGDGIVLGEQLVCLPHPAIQQGGGPQLAHAALDGLRAHEQVGLGLLPHPVQLLLGGAVVGQLAHQIPHGIQGLALLLPVQGGVHPQKAGVGVV